MAERTQDGGRDDRGKGGGDGVLRRHLKDECQERHVEETATAAEDAHQQTDGEPDQDQRQDPPYGELNNHPCRRTSSSAAELLL
jgi:hypothetical protein